MAMDAGARDIFLAERAPGIRRKIGEHLGIGDRLVLGTATGQPRRDRHQVGQFAGPFDEAVAGENLLDQRRARSRQTDDEDRIGCRTAAARACRKEGRGEQGGLPPALIGGVVRIVAERRVVGAIALGIGGEGGLVLALVLQRLAQREVEMDALLVVGRPIARRPHRRNVFRRETEGLEVGEAPPHFAEHRVLPKRGAIGVDRVVQPSDRP